MSTRDREAERPIYAIGDVQGCRACLDDLLAGLPADAAGASLWFAGDIVNRGPDSLGAIERIRGLGARATTVLGNHDLHLLASIVGVRKPSRRDTLAPILESAMRDTLADWLRARPLAHFERGFLMVHAGVHPDWSLDATLAHADELQRVLRGPHWGDFLRVMYGNGPSHWHDGLTGDDRLRAIVNVFTRMRFVGDDGALELDAKGEADQAPEGFRPWFEQPVRGARDGLEAIVFGHWSTLGLMLAPGHIALDTGCVWGGSLTAVRLPDRAVFQAPCPPAQDPGQS